MNVPDPDPIGPLILLQFKVGQNRSRNKIWIFRSGCKINIHIYIILVHFVTEKNVNVFK